jgi:hypothetical protein
MAPFHSCSRAQSFTHTHLMHSCTHTHWHTRSCPGSHYHAHISTYPTHTPSRVVTPAHGPTHTRVLGPSTQPCRQVWSLGREESGIRSGEVKGFCELPATVQTCGSLLSMVGLCLVCQLLGKQIWGRWSFEVSPGKKIIQRSSQQTQAVHCRMHRIPAMLEAR